MYKKALTLLLCCVSICVLASFRQSSSESSNRLSSDNMCTYSSSSSRTENSNGGEEMSKCKLFVNGSEIPNLQNAMIDSQKRNAEIPLLTVLRSLGAVVTWESNGHITI